MPGYRDDMIRRWRRKRDHDWELGQAHLRRLRCVIDEGRFDDPKIIHAVESLENRFKAGFLDERMMAEFERLALLTQDWIDRRRANA
jgi:hypothetical protein